MGELLIGALGLISVLGLYLCFLLSKVSNIMFSDKATFIYGKRRGLTDQQAHLLVARLRPKIGKPGLPSWE